MLLINIIILHLSPNKFIVENIASISEEHAATSEEILAALNEQDQEIGVIFDITKDILKSSNELENIN